MRPIGGGKCDTCGRLVELICVYMCEYVCICVYMCKCVYMCVNMCAYAFICVQMCVYVLRRAADLGGGVTRAAHGWG